MPSRQTRTIGNTLFLRASQRHGDRVLRNGDVCCFVDDSLSILHPRSTIISSVHRTLCPDDRILQCCDAAIPVGHDAGQALYAPLKFAVFALRLAIGPFVPIDSRKSPFAAWPTRAGQSTCSTQIRPNYCRETGTDLCRRVTPKDTTSARRENCSHRASGETFCACSAARAAPHRIAGN